MLSTSFAHLHEQTQGLDLLRLAKWRSARCDFEALGVAYNLTSTVSTDELWEVE